MIRFILICITVVGYLILSIPLLIIEWIIGKFNPYAKDISSLRIIQAVFKFILWITGVEVTVIGEENVPKDQSVLYIGNHRSFFDIIASYSTIPVQVGFISKKEIKKIPGLGVWMKYLNCLFLDRENKKEGLKTILQAIENVKNGTSMFIMPEGTRSKTDEMLPFKKASFKIAEKANCKIIPVAISNSAEVFEKQFPRVKSGTIIVEYGEAIDLPNMDREERKNIAEIAQKSIQEMLDKNKA